MSWRCAGQLADKTVVIDMTRRGTRTVRRGQWGRQQWKQRGRQWQGRPGWGWGWAYSLPQYRYLQLGPAWQRLWVQSCKSRFVLPVWTIYSANNVLDGKSLGELDLRLLCNIHLKWRITCQIILSISFPRLSQTQIRTAWKWSRSAFNLFLDFSLYVTVASTAVFASSDPMRTLINAPTARKHNSRSMESPANILITSLLYLSYKLCWQTLYMQRRCAIEQIMYMSLALSRTFLVAPIIRLCSTHCPHQWGQPLFLLLQWMWHCPWPFDRWFCSIQEVW